MFVLKLSGTQNLIINSYDKKYENALLTIKLFQIKENIVNKLYKIPAELVWIFVFPDHSILYMHYTTKIINKIFCEMINICCIIVSFLLYATTNNNRQKISNKNKDKSCP